MGWIGLDEYIDWTSIHCLGIVDSQRENDISDPCAE